MINHRSLVCTGALALLMTAPALAWEGEGRDHGPGYQTYRQSGGGGQAAVQAAVEWLRVVARRKVAAAAARVPVG